MDIRTVQEQLGHKVNGSFGAREGALGYKDIRTTQIYTHVLQQGGNAVVSPLADILGSQN